MKPFKCIVYQKEQVPLCVNGFASTQEAFRWARDNHNYGDDVFVILERQFGSDVFIMGGIFDGAEETHFEGEDMN